MGLAGQLGIAGSRLARLEAHWQVLTCGCQPEICLLVKPAALSCPSQPRFPQPATPHPAQREEERKAAAAALMDEVARGNAELAERKRQLRAAAVEEDRQIAEYIRQRDQREQVGC